MDEGLAGRLRRLLRFYMVCDELNEKGEAGNTKSTDLSVTKLISALVCSCRERTEAASPNLP